MNRASRVIELLYLLPQLRDAQSELLLLRSCMGIPKKIVLRTCQPNYIEKVTIWFIKELRRIVEDILVCGGHFFGDIQWRMALYPLEFGDWVYTRH